MADAPTLIAPPHRTVRCHACGYRLADATPTGLRVVVPHRRREDGTIVARCPACRWKAFWQAEQVAA